MKRTRIKEERIPYALLQAEMATLVGQVTQAMDIRSQTFYQWKEQYGQMDVEKIREIKRLVADLSLDEPTCIPEIAKPRVRYG